MTDFPAKIAALEEAAASGVLTIESEGERITYRSTADLLRALDYFRSRLSAADRAARPASTLAVYDPR